MLNLYAGIGGNRKLWGNEHKITAVEQDSNIAKIYCDFFPKDEMIIGNAHKFLLENFGLYDFIWSSPPCPTHSTTNYFLHTQGIIRYPSMELWQEIIFLKTWFKGKWCVENVKSYYKPLYPPIERDRHYFWSNFFIGKFKAKKDFTIYKKGIKELEEYHKIKLPENAKNKRLLLRNCVYPPLGLYILNESKKERQRELGIDEHSR